MYSRVTISMILLVLLGCSEKDDIKNDEELTMFKEVDALGLSCKGHYYLKANDGSTHTGNHSFNVYMYPGVLKAFYTNFQASGSYDRNQKSNNNQVVKIDSVDSEWVGVAGYKFNRTTLKYKRSFTVQGECKKVNVIPMPKPQF